MALIRNTLTRLIACLAVALMLTSLSPVAASAAPAQAFDYTKIKGLSQPTYDYQTQVVRETLLLPMADGVAVYLEITRPNDKTQHPVILEASPYHGTLADRDGTRILPEPRDADSKPLGLTRYFAPRGYAVVMMDLRGTGKSQGCLDHLGPKDAKDLKAVVEWAAGQPWSNGRVGMTGHSYVGSTPSLAAAMKPRGLTTIVPSAGLATMYDHQFQAGVPYFLQWAGPMYAYEQIALERHLPGGESFGKNVENTGCGLPNSSLVTGEDQASGRYAPWHAERDWRAAATAADIPVFMVHGVNDNAARVAGMEWFTKRGGRTGDKIWLGQWDHGSGCCPTRRGIQWTYALHAWFDKHLAGRKVDTGPAAELFLSDGTFEGARTGDRSQILVTNSWPVPGASTLDLYPTADGQLATSRPSTAGGSSFTGDPRGATDPQGTGGVDFATAPMTRDTVLAGQPQLDLVASVTVERVHLIATLYDEFPDGARRRISQFAINPELREGLDKVTPVVPTVAMTMKPPGFAMAHDLRAGHKLVLRVTASDPDKVPAFAADPRITVMTGPTGTALRVPVVADPALMADTVPLEIRSKTGGPAQATIRGSVTPAAPGAGQRVSGVNSEFFEFDVQERKDNANLIVGAIPAGQADIDLYLQRRNADGTWSGDLASGGSSSLTEEQLRLARPTPGRYRVEVHNWAGLPGTRVDLTLTFINSDGVPGGAA
ncbi:CocE/NonD family hydrolase [Actinomadura alba]|uniref:CocE/NonD family hydrolase n=1 Tax=Actinomadura alba TaxID=406431 RepID=A0ABR7LVP1_9ACTN|nr:CocE/NonD family hydrolase [Actinomadura alba]MBC6468644.1 CocE/NonD family hydrolase [Actinomadura alba]